MRISSWYTQRSSSRTCSRCSAERSAARSSALDIRACGFTAMMSRLAAAASRWTPGFLERQQDERTPVGADAPGIHHDLPAAGAELVLQRLGLAVPPVPQGLLEHPPAGRGAPL